MLPGGVVAKPLQRPLLWTATNLADTCGVGFMREAAGPVPGRSLPKLADLTPSGAGAPIVSTVSDGNLVAALRASAAIPGVFDPVTLRAGPGTYVDGGVLNNSPLSLARYSGATEIDAVLLVRPVAGNDTFRNAVSIVEKSYAVMRQRILDDAIVFALLQSDPDVRIALRGALTRSPLREQVPANSAIF